MSRWAGSANSSTTGSRSWQPSDPPHDFYFLYEVYRQRLQTIYFEQIEKPELASDERHLEAWRDPRTIYDLFAYTYRQALSPLRVHPFVQHVPRGGRVAEYGCGAAPVLPALARRYRRLNLQLVGADIPHMLFHYARWKFRNDRFVTMVAVGPNDDAALFGSFDTIFCLETLGAPAAAAASARALPPGAQTWGTSRLRLRALGRDRP